MQCNADHGDSDVASRSARGENRSEERWTQLLLNWVNLCVQPETEVRELNQKVLFEIICKYYDDVCDSDADRALTSADDVEPFIKSKYPAICLGNIKHSDSHMLCVVTSLLLYHCCVSSRSGAVDADICCHLDLAEQELLLKFCEKLGVVEVTVENVEAAIAETLKSTSAMNCAEPDPEPSSEAQKEIEGDTPEPPPPPRLDSNSTLGSQSLLPKQTVFAPQTPVIVLQSTVHNSSRDVSYYRQRSLSSFDSMDSQVYNVKESRKGKKKENKKEKKREVKFQEQEYTTSSSSGSAKCQPVCSCTACDKVAKGCGDTGDLSKCEKPEVRRCTRKEREIPFSMSRWFKLIAIMVAIGILLAVALIPFMQKPAESYQAPPPLIPLQRTTTTTMPTTPRTPFRTTEYPGEDIPADVEILEELVEKFYWECQVNLCQKVFEVNRKIPYFKSLSRCTLLCTGPLLWPAPIGYTYFSNAIAAFGKRRTEYKFRSVPSVIVHQFLAEAFKLFLADLERLERIDLHSGNKNRTQDLTPKKFLIEMHVNVDADPRLRLDTDESYTLKVETTDSQVKVEVQSPSFAGVRHGLETLGQLIYLDQTTGYLITLSNVIIKDAPTYHYRGLMIDTGRNYIPMPDLIRTIDAMSSVKFNTFHWRISDGTSFPFLLPDYPELFEYGSYDRSLIYTTEDVRTLVSRAGLRGIRVLIEVAAPGPVGRAWSWTDAAVCQNAGKNRTHCDEELCRRLRMKHKTFEILQNIYFTILTLSKVDDIFHMSDGMFSLVECFYLLDSREGFLNEALDRLRIANRGLLPQLPIIWHTSHLSKPYEASAWNRYGVQLNEWRGTSASNFLTNYKVIHSSRWDLACEMQDQKCIRYKSWQELYEWRKWRSLEVFSILGGETTLWTDLVDSTNLDSHLWPRAMAVAERLWSDAVANNTAGSQEILRLDAQRWRLLLRSVKVQPVWPVWCTFNPRPCLARIK